MVYQTVLVLVVQVLEQEELAQVVLELVQEELELVQEELGLVQEDLGLVQELGVQELKQVCIFFIISVKYTLIFLIKRSMHIF